jgi:type II secretory pathway pseudopilin PulG
MQQVMKKTIKTTAKKNTRYGDTIVEAVIAIAIYSIVAVLALGAMNSGLKSAQKNLESTMSRAAVDSQVDSLRYIYENYLVALNTTSPDSEYFKNIWEQHLAGSGPALGHMHKVTSEAEIANFVHSLDDYSSCEDIISVDANMDPYRSVFAINGRALYSRESIDAAHLDDAGFNGVYTRSNDYKAVIIDGKTSDVQAAPLYPRIIYQDKHGNEDEVNDYLAGGSVMSNDMPSPSRVANRAEGIWIVAIEVTNRDTEKLLPSYDFYVRTCWNPAGEKSPSLFTTVVRLYKAD